MSRFSAKFARLIGAAMVAVPLLAGLQALPASADTFVPPHWVKQIGQSGHATLYPWGMAHEPDGTLVVSDYNNYNLKLYSTSGTLLKTFGSRGTAINQISQPYTTAVDPNDGSIYVADPLGAKYLKYDSSGNWLSSTLVTAPDLYVPAFNLSFVYNAYMNTDAQGHVWVVSSHNIDSPLAPPWPARVLEYDSLGNQMVEFGVNGSAAGQLGVIRGIAVSATNNLVYVADSLNKRISVFDQSGNFQFQFGSGGNGPGQLGTDLRQIAIDDASGLVYVSDASHANVHQYNLTGTWIRDIGTQGVATGQTEGVRGITVNTDGNLYVADYALFRMDVFKSDGTFLAQLPTPAAAPPAGGFNFPEGIGIDSVNGYAYVTDTFNNRFEKFDLNGNFLSMWGFRVDKLLDANAMDYPRGAAVDPNNQNVWVDDTRGADIKGYTKTGAFIRAFGTQGPADNQFLYARGIWVMPNGNLLVPDSFNFRLKKIDQFGNLIASVPCGTYSTTGQKTLLMGCTGITMDAAGFIYVASPVEGVVDKFDSNLTLVGTIGSLGTGPGQFTAVYSVAVSGNRLYAQDTGANAIDVFDLSGNFLGAWGSRGRAHGQFNSAKGIATDANGLIYVVDTANERVEVFAP